MSTKIIQLYDYHHSKVPEHLTRWRVSGEEIQQRLEEMAQRHKETVTAEIVDSGDGVRCICVEGTSLHGRDTVLLYPGRNLQGAECAETAALGKKQGDVFHALIHGESLCLKVVEIIRHCPTPPITDELVRAEGPDGIDSIEAFGRQYREENEARNRSQKLWQITSFWFREMVDKSQFSIDEAEQDAYVKKMARWQYDIQIMSGRNPCIPENGTDLLTEEQAIAQFYPMYEDTFRSEAIAKELYRKMGLKIEEEDVKSEYDRIMSLKGTGEARIYEAMGDHSTEVGQQQIMEQIRNRMETNAVIEQLQKEAVSSLEV